ncbi:hypothetical protein hmeg3_13060 [Herbaspirillum sp. meg3]|uniref:hypothetical protein n=1 Tax=Herbaspirillum sp. meg3 TaxID=2025949 RepID=UPI000B98230C|nr:hypothetical protein [Herbaspirillum sp. meg3]ASU39123.1 hypothetical protein hmeg3_13060 [Herbaspirillum sp. meg3]
MASKRPPLHRADDINDLLLHSKALQPISPIDVTELERIAKLDVSKYSEADVRAEIIDPVIRILGYQKETFFSLQREKHLKVLEGNLFIDYSMTLWSEAFWVIEAKKVKRKPLRFSVDELLQALQYAVHPDIRATLVVLCDGRVFEVYDLEESVIEPAARVEVKKLPKEFSQLQKLLAPWQAWFFQKRRLLRLVDKVLDYEINPGRLDEFKQAIERRLEDKRGRIIENWRTTHPLPISPVDREAVFSGMSAEDLINAEFFIGPTVADINAMARVLVVKAQPSAFKVMHGMFPDLPRDMNDHFAAASLRTLIEFDSSNVSVNWLPSWLGGGGGGQDVNGAIKKVIALGLTTFDGDRSRKIVLQYSACARRLAKIAMALVPNLTEAGQRNHKLLRYLWPELDIAQIMSSPGSQNIRLLDGLQVTLTNRFVAQCMDDRKKFNIARAETSLKDSWQFEQSVLQDGQKYWTSLAGRGIDDEMYHTENYWVNYDYLGHLILLVVGMSTQKWSDYVLLEHKDDVIRLAKGGSWKARELLGLDFNARMPCLSDEDMANRFFDGDLPLYQKLSRAYANRPSKY